MNKIINVMSFIFLILTIALLYIIYNNLDLSLSFLKIYFALSFIILLNLLYVIASKLKKSSFEENKKNFFKFSLAFITFFSLNLIFNYVYNEEQISFFDEFSKSLGPSIFVTFIESFLKSKNKKD